MSILASYFFFKTMFLEEEIVSTLAITFFIICVVSILHLYFFVSNSDVKKVLYN